MEPLKIRLVDIVTWARNHVEALRAANIAPWHILRAEMIRDALVREAEAQRIIPASPDAKT